MASLKHCNLWSGVEDKEKAWKISKSILGIFCREIPARHSDTGILSCALRVFFARPSASHRFYTIFGDLYNYMGFYLKPNKLTWKNIQVGYSPSLTAIQAPKAMNTVDMLSHPWSNNSPKGDWLPVRLACLPSMASRLW